MGLFGTAPPEGGDCGHRSETITLLRGPVSCSRILQDESRARDVYLSLVKLSPSSRSTGFSQGQPGRRSGVGISPGFLREGWKLDGLPSFPRRIPLPGTRPLCERRNLGGDRARV